MKKAIKIFLFFVVIAILFLGVSVSMRIIYPLRYEDYIEKYSSEYNVDKFLVMALIKAESNYIYDAHSGLATGLMQITDETAQWIAEKIGLEAGSNDLKNPELNINMGCYYLNYLINYYNGNEDLAIAAYNAGMGNVNKWLKDTNYSTDGESLFEIPFEETKKYTKKVKDAVSVYKKLYGD